MTRALNREGPTPSGGPGLASPSLLGDFPSEMGYSPPCVEARPILPESSDKYAHRPRASDPASDNPLGVTARGRGAVLTSEPRSTTGADGTDRGGADTRGHAQRPATVATKGVTGTSSPTPYGTHTAFNGEPLLGARGKGL